MPSKILIVTKDRMEFNLYHPVAEMLKKLGYEIFIVAEGLSMDMWIGAGWEIYQGLPKNGAFDPNTKMRTDIDVYPTLQKVSPNVVLAGLSSPIHLGEMFAKAANSFKITLGFVEDLWFAHRRSKAIPNFVCTPDSFGTEAIVETSWYGGESFPKVHITGSPAMDALQDVKSDELVGNLLKTSGAHRVILIAGQGEATTPLVAGLLEAGRLAAAKGERWVILPRFHPKWMTDPSKAGYCSEWRRLIAQMEAYHQVMWTPPSTDIRTLIPLSTEVVSIYSNALIEAIALRRLAVSWTSEIGKQRMAEGFGGNTRFPLVEMDAVIEVSSPVEYLKEVPRQDRYDSVPVFLDDARRKVMLDGKATQRVVTAIREYLD